VDATGLETTGNGAIGAAGAGVDTTHYRAVDTPERTLFGVAINPQFLDKLAVFRGDLLGGFTAAAVMLAIEGSYGVMALTPLGAEYAGLAFMWAVYTAVICNLAAVLCGQRGPVLGGPSSPMSVLVLSLIVGLLTEPNFALASGRPDIPLILAFAAGGVVLAGIFQVFIGLFGFGRIVKFMPYPVYAGFMNATAVLMVVAMLPHVLGVTGPLSRSWMHMQPITVVAALVAAVIALKPPRWARPLPPYLIAMVAGTLVYHGLRLAFPGAAAGPTLSLSHFDWPRLDVLAPLAHPPGGN
jgi:SulP family sulfate permease